MDCMLLLTILRCDASRTLGWLLDRMVFNTGTSVTTESKPSQKCEKGQKEKSERETSPVRDPYNL
jgi:hypothetical protein